MAETLQERRDKIRILTTHIERLVKNARIAYMGGRVPEWRQKILAALVLTDHAWKIAEGNASVHDEIAAATTIDTINARFQTRMEEFLAIKQPAREAGTTEG